MAIPFQTLGQMLYRAASDGDVNPHVVSDILGVSRNEAEAATGTSANRSAGDVPSKYGCTITHKLRSITILSETN